MNIVEQIEQLKEISFETRDNFNVLEDALLEYHKMIEEGCFKPRENQLQQTYTVLSYQSNYR